MLKYLPLTLDENGAPAGIDLVYVERQTRCSESNWVLGSKCYAKNTKF
jgi:hypothetical protein